MSTPEIQLFRLSLWLTNYPSSPYLKCPGSLSAVTATAVVFGQWLISFCVVPGALVALVTVAIESVVASQGVSSG